MPKPVPTTASELHARWESILTQQRRSGLSGAAFCRKEHLPLRTFYAWKRLLQGGGQRSRKQPAAPTPAPAFRFQQIKLRTEERAGLEIVAPDGWRLCFREVPDAAGIASLLRRLRGGESC